jgi:hypothetical protein
MEELSNLPLFLLQPLTTEMNMRFRKDTWLGPTATWGSD